MRRLLFLTYCILLALAAKADSWDYIIHSNEYYFGVGKGASQQEAENNAMEAMMASIATNISSGFEMINEETNQNGNIDSKTKIHNCIKSYSQGSFTNVGVMTQGKEPDITVLKYMKRTELAKIFEQRTEAAKDWMRRADEAIAREKVDMALQYYYWAYALVRSLQHPYTVKDAQGNLLTTVLPAKIRSILEKIDVEYVGQDGEFINVRFTYNGRPISTIDFAYNDGESNIEECKAQDGRGCLEMAHGHENKKQILINIEYEYKGAARGDAQLQSVLDVVPRTHFKEAAHRIERKDVAEQKQQTQQNRQQQPADVAAQDAQKAQQPSETQQPDNIEQYAATMGKIVEAMRTGQYISVDNYFDIEGLSVFQKVTRYGTPRLVGEQNFSFYKGANGTVTARGMQVAFTFTSPKKVTFTESLAFTFNKEGKICNVAFGLGNVAEQDILLRNTDWGDDVKEQIMEFLENYKTAYCLRRHDYIKSIFADDAVIIVGRVVHKSGGTTNIGEKQITSLGQDIITHNRYSKDEYLKNLQKCFDNPRNKYINIKFGENDVQTLKTFSDRKVFGIQIQQQYNSATYGDLGYLFLMVDMTNPDEPQIKVRTWQPNETPMKELFNAGDFYK